MINGSDFFDLVGKSVEIVHTEEQGEMVTRILQFEDGWVGVNSPIEMEAGSHDFLPITCWMPVADVDANDPDPLPELRNMNAAHLTHTQTILFNNGRLMATYCLPACQGEDAPALIDAARLLLGKPATSGRSISGLGEEVLPALSKIFEDEIIPVSDRSDATTWKVKVGATTFFVIIHMDRFGAPALRIRTIVPEQVFYERAIQLNAAMYSRAYQYDNDTTRAHADVQVDTEARSHDFRVRLAFHFNRDFSLTHYGLRILVVDENGAAALEQCVSLNMPVSFTHLDVKMAAMTIALTKGLYILPEAPSTWKVGLQALQSGRNLWKLGKLLSGN